MGLIKALTLQCVPSFFYRGKGKDSVSVAESAITDTFKTQTDSKLSPAQGSLSPAGWSLRSKVEIAALLLFFSYRAASFLATTAVNTAPPIVLAVLLGMIVFRVCQISMKNLLQNTAVNVAAGMATVALGPNPTGHTPEDDFDGVVHDTGVLGTMMIPDREDVSFLPRVEVEEFDGVIHDAGVLGMVMIPERELKEVEAQLPEPKEVIEDPIDWAAEMGGMGFIETKVYAPKISEPKVSAPANPEPEEESDWASSMGGFFFSAIHVIGFLFLM